MGHPTWCLGKQTMSMELKVLELHFYGLSHINYTMQKCLRNNRPSIGSLLYFSPWIKHKNTLQLNVLHKDPHELTLQRGNSKMRTSRIFCRDCDNVTSGPDKISRFSNWSKAYYPSRWSYLEVTWKAIASSCEARLQCPATVEDSSYFDFLSCFCLFYPLFMRESEIPDCLELLLCGEWKAGCPKDSPSCDFLSSLWRLSKWASSSVRQVRHNYPPHPTKVAKTRSHASKPRLGLWKPQLSPWDKEIHI